ACSGGGLGRVHLPRTPGRVPRDAVPSDDEDHGMAARGPTVRSALPHRGGASRGTPNRGLRRIGRAGERRGARGMHPWAKNRPLGPKGGNMAPIEPDDREHFVREEKETPPQPSGVFQKDVETRKVVTGGSVAEAVGGAAAVLLTILGLAGIVPV